MILFCVTGDREAENILTSGFENSDRCVGTSKKGSPIWLTGIWFTDRPVWDQWPCDAGNLPRGWTCLAIDVPDDYLHLLEEGAAKTNRLYREFCFSAIVANQFPVCLMKAGPFRRDRQKSSNSMLTNRA